MAITMDHIHIVDIGPETRGHEDPSRYVTVTFRVLEANHPNSFEAPVSVNIDQFGTAEIERHARYVFHHLMRTLAETTESWSAMDHPTIHS